MAAWTWNGPGLRCASAASSRADALGDLVVVPTRPVLLVQDDEVSGIVDPCRPPRVVDEHQRQEAESLGLVGHQGAHGPGQPDRFGAQALSHEVRAGGGGVALVEQEVQHRQDGGGPVDQEVGRRDAKGDAGVADLALGPDQPLGHRGLGNEEGPGDLRRRHAGEGPQRERHLRVEGQRRVTTGVHEAEAVVGHVVRARGVVCGRSSSRLRRSFAAPSWLRRIRSSARFRATVVSHAPGRRGMPSSGPAFQRPCEGILRALLGHVPVAREPDERGDHPAPLLVEGLGDRRVDIGAHISQIGLTSMLPVRAPGIFAATSIASSRSLQSTR